MDCSSHTAYIYFREKKKCSLGQNWLHTNERTWQLSEQLNIATLHDSFIRYRGSPLAVRQDVWPRWSPRISFIKSMIFNGTWKTLSKRSEFKSESKSFHTNKCYARVFAFAAQALFAPNPIDSHSLQTHGRYSPVSAAFASRLLAQLSQGLFFADVSFHFTSDERSIKESSLPPPDCPFYMLFKYSGFTQGADFLPPAWSSIWCCVRLTNNTQACAPSLIKWFW